MKVGINEKIRTFRQKVEEAAQVGASYLPQFIDEKTIIALQDLCRRLKYKLIDEQYENGVKERYYIPIKVATELKQQVEVLRNKIKVLALSCKEEFPSLATWNPSHFSIQLYDSDSYITSHRDHKVNRGIIVVISIQGEADFEVSRERGGTSFARWRLKPGDATILRASGMNANIDGHPGVFHTVSGAKTDIPRISIGFRDKG